MKLDTNKITKEKYKNKEKEAQILVRGKKYQKLHC